MANHHTFTADFSPADEQSWRALVAKTLREAPFDSLKSVTPEGLVVEPLYDAPAAPATVAARRPFDAERPWDIRTLAAHPDPVRANTEILRDLEGGAASVLLRLDPLGRDGVAIGGPEGLSRVLEGVIVELATVGLDAGFMGPAAADWLGAAAKASPGAKLMFHLDPLSVFAETGASPGPVEAHMVSAATVAARLAGSYPQAGLFLASGRVIHEAGGGDAGELAFAMAAAVAYAKALVRAGLSMDEAFGRIVLGLSADGDYFTVIAKLRAARALWARLTQACGATAPARMEVRSSRRMLTAQDPWTNMVRLTLAGFGAAVGGADAIVLGNFTDALGLPNAFARRQSRNAQLVLMEEAHIGRVADPGAGSNYLETLSDQLARAAWALFQSVEAAGGLVAALSSGQIAAEVEKVRALRDEAGKPKIVGVTAFPPAQDTPAEIESPTPKAVDAPSTRLPGPDGACPALAPIRLAQPHEASK